MTDANVLLVAAAALIAVLLIPVSQTVRTALFVIVIGAAACWELTSGLGAAMRLFD